jgi:hydroxymethylbilane synthase
MPLAAHATFSGDTLTIHAAWGDPDGKHALVNTQAAATVTDTAAAVALGERVAHALQAAVRQAGHAL